MFKEEREEQLFNWAMIGDINTGRPNLGETMNVATYRLMQFTLRDVLVKELGVEKADELFYLAGKKAGSELFENVISEKHDFNGFIKEAESLMKDLKIGILRVEKSNMDDLKFTLVVEEDLDCSGLPVAGEVICVYDEGFLSGLLSSFTGVEFKVKEIDCWCSGDRVCRFVAEPLNSGR